MNTEAQDSVADAVKGHWVDRLPRAFRPYAQLARLDRPIGWWLLLMPCWWATAMAALSDNGALPNLWHLFLFWVGAVFMRGAGCTYNDIIDREIDAQVARTKSRPIPSGRVSTWQAIHFLIFQCLVGLVVLLQFNTFTIFLGIASLGVVATYPFMKRITSWPQVVLGFAFSWGAFLGWSATYEEVGFASILLYIGAVLWIVGYDTIYAHQDREDDVLVGVKSTARRFGDYTKHWLVGLYFAATTLFAGAFIWADASFIAFIGLGFGVLHMAYQIIRLDIDNAEQCLKLFRSNRDYGLIVFGGLLADVMLQGLFN